MVVADGGMGQTGKKSDPISNDRLSLHAISDPLLAFYQVVGQPLRIG